MRKERGGRGSTLAIAVLISLGLLSAVNLNLIKAPLEKYVTGEVEFSAFVEQVQKGYTSSAFRTKNTFLNLNGLFARLTGRRVLNNVVRCKSGQLARVQEKIDVTELAEELFDFSEYLEEYEEIPFFYVQIPCKENFDGILPKGVTSFAQENTNALMVALKEKGVKTVDLRPELAQTLEQIERYYYKTDHHWNGDGAFVAFQEIMAEMNKIFPNMEEAMKYTYPEQWERHVKENWFLGSLGKRVGLLFGGTDPLIWYTPRFATEMSCIIPKHKQLFKGDFLTSNIRSQYIEKKNYFEDNSYCVCIGGDYPLVQHRNIQAPLNLKVLLIKDSYMLPLQAYLSTVFQEVDVIDPRYFSECTPAEYAAWTQPDVVIMAINPSVFDENAYRQLGAEQAYMEWLERKNDKTVMGQCDIEIEARDSDHNYKGVSLEPNAVYRVSFDGVEVLKGTPQGVSVMLYDATTEKLNSSILFDLEYGKAVEKFVWTFKTPQTENDLQLLFYAGIHGDTAQNSVIYRNMTLEMCGS